MSEATRTWLPSGASPTIRVHGRGSKTTASGLATLSFLTHSRQHATRISPSDCTGANPRSCKINWSAVGAPRKVVPNGEGRRGLHIIMIHSSRRCKPQPNNRGPPKTPESQPRNGGNGGKKGTQRAAPKRENQTREGNQGAPRISPSRANFPRLVQVWACAVPWGGGYQRLRQLSPPGVRCASVPDGRGPGWCAGRWRCPASSRGPLRDVIDALERSSLRIPQNQLPDGIGDVACLGGLAESEPGHLLVHDGDVPQRGRGLHPAVVLQPLLHPAVVEALRRLVQHQLQDGLAGRRRVPPPPARQYPSGLPFCLRDEFPRGDGAQDQATLHVRPEDMLHLHRIVLLPVVLTHHAVVMGVASPGADVRAIGTCPAPRGGGVQAHQLDHVVGVAELAVDGGGH